MAQHPIPCVLTWLILAGSAASGCTGSDIELSIDLRTDFVPGAEFVAVGVTIVGERDTFVLAAEGDFIAGVRLVDLDSFEPNRARTIRIELLDRLGASIAERIVLLDHREDRGMSIVLSRDCRPVMCPAAGAAAATACLGGRCIEPTCIDGTEATCPEPECTTDSDCPSLDVCAQARCLDTVCLYEPRANICEMGMFCSPEQGCLPLPTPAADAGLDAGSDAPPPMAPRITWPLNGASTGSTNPRLRLQWTAVSGALNYEVQMQRGCDADQRRECTFDSPTYAEEGIAGTMLLLPADLPQSRVAPVGERYRWRVRGCMSTECGAWSTVRYLDVGRGASDVDGDGRDDLVVGYNEHATHFEFEGADFVVRQELDSPFTGGSATFGRKSQFGDINGDGFADVIISAESDQGVGAAAIYLGGLDGLESPMILDPPADSPSNGFFSRSLCIGDFDADGFADVVVQSIASIGFHLYRGSAAGLDPNRVRAFPGSGAMPSCVDINEDGYADLVVSNTYRPGHPTDLLESTSAPLPNAVHEFIGDANGDGFGDYLSFSLRGAVRSSFVAYGVLGGLRTLEEVAGVPGASTWDYQVLASGDLNGDMFADPVSGSSFGELEPGWAQGGESGLSERRALTIACAGDCVRGQALTYGFDLNADGYGDAALSALGEEAIFVFFGGPAGIASPPLRVDRSDVRFDGFGYSL